MAASVYVVVLTNRLTADIPARVPAAVVKAGLPAASVPAFLEGFTTGNFTDVKGLTPSITVVGVQAYKLASASAYQTVFLTSIAFTGLAVIVAFWAPNVEDKMTGQVATTLHGKEGGVVGASKFEEKSGV